LGEYNKNPIPNPLEVNAYKWVNLNWLEKILKIIKKYIQFGFEYVLKKY